MSDKRQNELKWTNAKKLHILQEDSNNLKAEKPWFDQGLARKKFESPSERKRRHDLVRISRIVKAVLDSKVVTIMDDTQTGQTIEVYAKEALVLVALYKAIRLGDNDMIKWLATMHETGCGDEKPMERKLGAAEMEILKKAGIVVPELESQKPNQTLDL